MRKITLTANVMMNYRGTIRGGSFISCLNHKQFIVSVINFTSWI